ncbi:MAG: hypothetical protein F9K49_04285 [Caedimonadaceae bacterium]|nr:MAG: hypothetical protein F9K49_04285 [Caedimonadaceae bacterium]
MSWNNSNLKESLRDYSEKALHLFHSASSRLLAPLRVWFHPQSSTGIRRQQFFWLSCGIFGVAAISYGVVVFLFDKAPQRNHEPPKPTPLNIATATQKVDLNEVRWQGLDETTKKLSEDIASLKQDVKDFLDGQKKSRGDTSNITEFNKDEEELNNTLSEMERQAGSQSQGEQATPSTHHVGDAFKSPEPQPYSYSAPLMEEKEHGQLLEGAPLIQKFSLNLTDNLKNRKLKTVETTIPAGAFAKTILLSGLDASSAMNASSDPRPMLLRIVDYGTLPRRFQSNLKDCHCTASAFGDLSSERIYARLEKLTCVERTTGEIIETQVAGYISGGDGKAGIRGVVAYKDGQFLTRSLMGGFFAGLSNVANPQNRQSQVNPFYPGSLPTIGAQVSPPGVGSMFASGMASGATTALDRLSQYYIDRAEQLQPVIQVAAGQVVDIVFTEGTFIGSQSAHVDARGEKASN